MKRVYYNGHKDALQDCQSASNLKAGVCYEVESEVALSNQINYILRKVSNHIEKDKRAGYSSAWFKVVPVYQVIADEVPRIGGILENFMQLSNKFDWEKVAYSSKILDVHQLCENMYEVYTMYSTYIVQVR